MFQLQQLTVLVCVLVSFANTCVAESVTISERPKRFFEARQDFITGDVSESRDHFSALTGEDDPWGRAAAYYLVVCDVSRGKEFESELQHAGRLNSRIFDYLRLSMVSPINHESRLIDLDRAGTAEKKELLILRNASFHTPNVSDLQTIQTQLEIAKQQLESQANASNVNVDGKREKLIAQIHYVAWELLLAEQVVGAERGLVVTAAESFESGYAVLKEINPAMEDEKVVKDLFDNAPDVLAQYDTMLFRANYTTAAFVQNQSDLKQRVKELQGIARAYRDVATMSILAHRDYQLAHPTGTQTMLAAANERIHGLQTMLNESQDQQFLLEYEPTISELDTTSSLIPKFESGVTEQIELLGIMADFNLVKENDKPSDETNLEQLSQRVGTVVDELEKLEKGGKQNISGQKALAKAIQGYIEEEWGLRMSVSSLADVADRQGAQVHFEAAKKAYGDSIKAIENLDRANPNVVANDVEPFLLASAESGVPVSWILHRRQLPPTQSEQGIVVDLKKRKELLDSSDSLIAEAHGHLKDPISALAILEPGIRRHTDSKLWLEYLSIWHRSGERIDELYKILNECIPTNDRDATIFEWNDYRPLVLRAKFNMDQIRKELGQEYWIDPTTSAPDILRRNLRDRCAVGTLELQRVLELIASEQPSSNGTEKKRVEALLAFYVAMEGLLNDESNYDYKVELAEALASAKSAVNVLQEYVPTNVTTLDGIENTEAIVVALLAHGFLALQLEKPDSPLTKEARNAFAAALDFQALLPHDRTRLRIMGSPLAQLLRYRGVQSGDGTMDRVARQAMEYFVDGSFSLTLGLPENAVNRMEQGEQILKQETVSNSEIPPLTEAIELLRRESSMSLNAMPELLAAYRILAQLDQINFEKTQAELSASDQADYQQQARSVLIQSLREIPSISESAADETSLATIQRAVDEVSSPLIGVVLAMAIEAKAVGFPLGETNLSQELFELARAALRKVDRLMDEESQARYALFDQLRIDVYERLSRPEYYAERVTLHVAKLQLDDATRTANAGLRRHPSDNALWKHLNELKTSDARMKTDRDSRRAAYESALRNAELWSQNVRAPHVDQLLAQAELHAELGNTTRALELLTQALSFNEQVAGQEQALVVSQLAKLRSMMVLNNE